MMPKEIRRSICRKIETKMLEGAAVVHVRGSDRKSAKHASASVATLVQRVNDFSPPTRQERKRVRNEFEARVDRFVIAVDPLFAKRLFLLAPLSLSLFIYRFLHCSFANSFVHSPHSPLPSITISLSLSLSLSFFTRSHLE